MQSGGILRYQTIPHRACFGPQAGLLTGDIARVAFGQHAFRRAGNGVSRGILSVTLLPSGRELSCVAKRKVTRICGSSLNRSHGGSTGGVSHSLEMTCASIRAETRAVARAAKAASSGLRWGGDLPGTTATGGDQWQIRPIRRIMSYPTQRPHFARLASGLRSYASPAGPTPAFSWKCLFRPISIQHGNLEAGNPI